MTIDTPSPVSVQQRRPLHDRERHQSVTPARWWTHLVWVAGAAVLGFVIPAMFAGALHLSRVLFVVPYLCVSFAFLFLYVRWSGIDMYARLCQHWRWGVLGAVLAGGFVVNNVLSQPASGVPTGLELAGAILWLGVVYGAIDALLLSVLPLFATWQALSRLGWTHSWPGRAAVGVLAFAASLLVAAAYHLGYPEFRNPSLVAPIIGNGVLSLASLLTWSPIAAIGGHIAMHIAAVLHGAEATLQLPPHY